MREREERTDGDAQTDLINYMPAMPTLSKDLGVFEFILKRLGSRRGGLRRVVEQREETFVQTDD